MGLYSKVLIPVKCKPKTCKTLKRLLSRAVAQWGRYLAKYFRFLDASGSISCRLVVVGFLSIFSAIKKKSLFDILGITLCYFIILTVCTFTWPNLLCQRSKDVKQHKQKEMTLEFSILIILKLSLQLPCY